MDFKKHYEMTCQEEFYQILDELNEESKGDWDYVDEDPLYLYIKEFYSKGVIKCG